VEFGSWAFLLTVSEFQRELSQTDRKIIGTDIKEVRFGRSLGIPLVRKMEKDLWEVRSHLEGRIARVLFSVIDGHMVLLHAFIKKAQKTPRSDLDTARARKAMLQEGVFMVNPHIGSDFDEFLKEEGIHEEVTAAAIKRVIAWQLEKLMKSKHITKTEMAFRMRTSRALVNRLLDEDDTSVTLATLARASLAIGAPLKIEFAINEGT
jgi:phage-related protein